jgi:hypothetical protein
MTHCFLVRDEQLFQRFRDQIKPPMQAGEINMILRVGPEFASADIAAYDNMRNSFNSTNALVDRFIMQSVQFQSWFGSKQSQALGIPDIFADQLYSPLSMFSATFLSIVQRHPLFLPLSYFCQPHTNDGLAGGSGLIRSLICQLAPHVNLQGLQREELQQSCGDLNYLLFIFQQMVGRLNGFAIFCVIDGIHYCDRNPVHANEISAVLTTLMQIASTPYPTMVFKLLVTGVGSSWFFRHGLPRSNQLAIEEDFRRNKEDYNEDSMAAELTW